MTYPPERPFTPAEIISRPLTPSISSSSLSSSSISAVEAVDLVPRQGYPPTLVIPPSKPILSQSTLATASTETSASVDHSTTTTTPPPSSDFDADKLIPEELDILNALLRKALLSDLTISSHFSVSAGSLRTLATNTTALAQKLAPIPGLKPKAKPKEHTGIDKVGIPNGAISEDEPEDGIALEIEDNMQQALQRTLSLSL